MWLNDKFHQWQTARAERYLTRYPDLGLQVLRRDEGLAARAYEVWADGKGGPDRDSIQWPMFATMGFRAVTTPDDLAQAHAVEPAGLLESAARASSH